MKALPPRKLPSEKALKVRILALEVRNGALRLHIDKLEADLKQSRELVGKLLGELSRMSNSA